MPTKIKAKSGYGFLNTLSDPRAFAGFGPSVNRSLTFELKGQHVTQR